MANDLAMVCGATGGLGPAVVQAFLKRGDRVIAVARAREDLDRLSSTAPSALRPEVADLTDADSVEALWRRLDDDHETLRWLVNVTGGYRSGKVVDSRPEDFPFMQDVNLATAWWSCRAAAARMQKAGTGAIVNVSSRAGLANERGSAAYALAKAGVIKLTQVLAEELKSSGVTVNVVIPAIIDTPANRRDFPPDALKKAVAPDAIARVIAFLCSEDANIITGASIPVYGRF